MLAEVDLGDSGRLPDGRPPVTWLAEVTDDERLTGGHLARLSASGLAALLHDLGQPTTPD